MFQSICSPTTSLMTALSRWFWLKFWVTLQLKSSCLSLKAKIFPQMHWGQEAVSDQKGTLILAGGFEKGAGLPLLSTFPCGLWLQPDENSNCSLLSIFHLLLIFYFFKIGCVPLVLNEIMWGLNPGLPLNHLWAHSCLLNFLFLFWGITSHSVVLRATPGSVLSSCCWQYCRNQVGWPSNHNLPHAKPELSAFLFSCLLNKKLYTINCIESK